MDTLSPTFITSFKVEYKFEESQRFKVEVYDVEDERFNKNSKLED